MGQFNLSHTATVMRIYIYVMRIYIYVMKKQNSDKSGQDGHGELEVSEIGARDKDNADVTEKELPPLAEGRISNTLPH
jgi:hypothetical protein